MSSSRLWHWHHTHIQHAHPVCGRLCVSSGRIRHHTKKPHNEAWHCCREEGGVWALCGHAHQFTVGWEGGASLRPAHWQTVSDSCGVVHRPLDLFMRTPWIAVWDQFYACFLSEVVKDLIEVDSKVEQFIIFWFKFTNTNYFSLWNKVHTDRVHPIKSGTCIKKVNNDSIWL